MKKFPTLAKLAILVLTFTLLFALTSCSLGGSLKIESCTVDRSTVKTQYYVGEEIDFSGLKLYVEYNDKGLNRTYSYSEVTVTYAEDITATPGTRTVTVTYYDPNLDKDQSVPVQITVVEDPNAVKHDSYVVDFTDVKTDYFVGDTVDLTGIKLFEKMSDGSTVEITNTAGLTYSYDASITATPGSKSIPASYQGESAGAVSITVKYPAISGIALNTENISTLWNMGDSITAASFSKLVATITYENGATKTQQEFTFTGLDTITATVGEKTVVVGFKDPISGTDQSATFKIQVDGIQDYLITPPSKLTYLEGESINFSDIVVIADCFSGQDVTVPFEDIDFGDTSTLTATSGSKVISVKVNGTEVGTFTIVVSDTIESITPVKDGVDLSYRVGETVSLSGLALKVVYTTGAADATIPYEDLTILTELTGITATPGTKSVTVKYHDAVADMDMMATVVITVYGIERYDFDTSNIKTTYLIGEEVDLTNLRVYAVYLDGGARVPVDLSTLTFADDISSKVGTNTVTFYLDGKAIGTVTFTIEKNSIVSSEITGEFKTFYEKGDKIDFTGLTITVTYKNGEVKTIPLSDITFKGADTSSVAKPTVIAGFKDPLSGEDVHLTFKIEVIYRAAVDSFEKPGSLSAFDSDNNKNAADIPYDKNNLSNGFSSQFIDRGLTYVIGDDNKFYLNPVFGIINENGSTSYLTNFFSHVEVSLWVEDAYVALTATPAPTDPNYLYFKNGDDLIVEVNTYRGEYQFSDKAVGEKVKLSVIPSSVYYKAENLVPVSLEANIIDAFNVFSEEQLAVIDNQTAATGNREENAWREFKLDHGIADIDPSGVVLHRDMALSADDMPTEFFYKLNKDITYYDGTREITVKAGTKYLKDWIEIYRRNPDKPFTIEGNFFTINTSGFPLIPSPAVFGSEAGKDYGSDYSNSALFYFKTQDDDTTLTPVTYNNIAFIGNAARNNVQDEDGALVSGGGLIQIKVSWGVEVTVNNAIGNSFFISYFSDYTGVLNINKVKCYDSYQNALFIWAQGTLKADTCYINGTGGPAALCESVDKNGDGSLWLNPVMTTTNTVIDTALAGDELWFQAVGASPIAADLKKLSAGLQITPSKDTNLGHFVDDKGKMNIVALLMPDGTDAPTVMNKVQSQGYFNFNGSEFERVIDTNTSDGVNHWTMDILKPHDLANSALCQGTAVISVYLDGTYYSMYYDSNNIPRHIDGTAFGADAKTMAVVGAFQASQYVTVSQGGFSIVFQLYH